MHEYYVTYKEDFMYRSTYTTVRASSKQEARELFISMYPEAMIIDIV